MPPAAQKRRRSSDALTFRTTKRRRVSDGLIERGVETEVDRTLPFWRCFQDLRLATRRVPAVESRHTRLLCRIPCKVFKRVDVVWARTTVQLRSTASPTPDTRKRSRLGTRKTNSAASAAEATSSPSEVGTSQSSCDTHDEAVRVHTIDTVHFVHEDAYKKGTGSAHSFHVQSVVLRDAPHILQCVGGSMVAFSFVVYTSLRVHHTCTTRPCALPQLLRELEGPIEVCRAAAVDSASHEGSSECAPFSCIEQTSTRAQRGAAAEGATAVANATAALRQWCPPPTTRVLVLGMGGNSMALALRLVLGSEALIEVVEVEPAVVASCLQMGTLSDADTNMRVHLQDAETCFTKLPSRSFDFIYMDIFEPMQATMRNLHPWVRAARTKLRPGGLLVLNEHQLPSAAAAAPYQKVFGPGNVQAVNLRGWSESVVVCVAPGDAVTDARSLEINKSCADAAFNIYEALLPGWLPHHSWLVKAGTYQHNGVRSRLWTS